MRWSYVRVAIASSAWLGMTAVARAAAVKGLALKKSLVAIELEEDETVEKGTVVCFYGESGKKVGCGPVTAVKGTLATVKIEDESALKKIKKGMAAKIGQADDSAAAADESAGKKMTKKSKKKKKGAAAEDGEAGPDSANGSDKSPFRVWIAFGPALATPATYNRVAYNYNGSATPASTWSPDKEISSTLVGLDLQLGIPVGGFSINPGIRYRKFTPSVVDADYTPDQLNPYVSTEQQAVAIGVFVDFQYFRTSLGQKGSLNLTTGIDADQSTVTANATLKDDTGQVAQRPVMTATSSLTVISWRLGATVDYMIAKPFGFFGGVSALIPLAEAGKSFSANMTDSAANANPQAPNPSADIQSALDHKKNTYGLEADLGVMFSF